MSASGSEDPYLRVARAIRDEIKESGLAPDTKLTPTRELASRFHVSEMTIGNAIRVLRDEGLVYTTKRGTFVSPAKDEQVEEADLSSQVADLKEKVRELGERVTAIESER